MIFGILRYAQLELPNKEAPLVLCLIGQPTSEPKLKSASGRLKISGRTISVFSQKLENHLISQCNIIVLGQEIQADLSQFTFNNQLLICDGCQSELEHVSIELINVSQKIGFNVNLINAHQNKVNFNASLLKLATEIHQVE